MYEGKGMVPTEDVGVATLSGSTLGGGTTVNWSASFRPPDWLIKEWVEEHGLEQLGSDEFQASVDAIWERSNVSLENGKDHNAMDALLAKGCEGLGYHYTTIARNTRKCDAKICSMCTFGCKKGAKQSTMKTFLQDAHDAGAEIVVGAQATKVLMEGNKAIGVQADIFTMNPDGSSIAYDYAATFEERKTTFETLSKPIAKLTVKAKRVVVCAGAYHSPGILKRSGINNPNVGKHLHLHPTTGVLGFFDDQQVSPWNGVPMTVVSNEFADLDGKHHGVKFETPVVHPGLLSAAIPWLSDGLKELVLKAPTVSVIIPLVRDRDTGTVEIDDDMKPHINYKMSEFDAKHFITGLKEGLKMLVMAGANQVRLGSRLPPFHVPDGVDAHDVLQSEEFKHYLELVEKDGVESNRMIVFSAHQMSTCRMGNDKSSSVTNWQGKVWDTENLFVADGSVFPSASGVNPMMTIMSLGHHIAQQIKKEMRE
eukprot:TRINITY_DN13309_c0_g2_i1.p1 TRINITY_DN13309_c0_g2~~TRINITY_DN13309_c0_g2_i1.p1  ORF type:complete len:507 (+),score=185.11 TRINITY_DN13309_c0_g2_i1:80-1522(+)